MLFDGLTRGFLGARAAEHELDRLVAAGLANLVDGEAVIVGEAVAVTVGLDVELADSVALGVAVPVTVLLADSVAVKVSVGLSVLVAEGVAVGVQVPVTDCVAVSVVVGVTVEVTDSVGVRVRAVSPTLASWRPGSSTSEPASSGPDGRARRACTLSTGSSACVSRCPTSSER